MIADWLKQLGLDQYADAFTANAIDAEMLPTLTDADLKEIGVAALGHRKRILAAAAAGPTAAKADVAPADERRQVTVLFADLAGYTRLSGSVDAEILLGMLQRFYAVADAAITDFGGRVDKHIGDCVMGVFGAPVAHGDDPERAVRAALKIRDDVAALATGALPNLAVHVGVASGEVVAAGVGSAARRDYTVTGETVNLASRLTDIAAAGEVLVSEAVRSALAERLLVASAGDHAVKGIDRPVAAWRVDGIMDRGNVASRLPLVGRRGELEQARALLSACAGQVAGSVLLVRGEAGIGKTRLVEAIGQAAASLGYAAHLGHVMDFGAGDERDAMRRIAEGLCDAASPDLSPGQRAVLLELAGRALGPELGQLREAMDAATSARLRREALALQLAAVGTRQPQLIVIEDVHWAQPDLLDRLAELCAAVAQARVLVVLTSRFEGCPITASWQSRVGDISLATVDLAPLRREDARDLALAIAASATEHLERCLARADGNPLFLEQLLRNADEAADQLPGSIQSVVLARLDRLPSSDRGALQAAAALGQRFSLAALRHVLNDGRYSAQRLIDDRLLRAEGDDLAFAHALIRDGVYASMLQTTRSALHASAAAWFAERDLALAAEHLDRAGDAKAAKAYLRAAEEQVRGFRSERARLLAQRGRDLARDADLRARLGELVGDAQLDLGRATEALAAYEAAREAGGDGQLKARTWIGTAAALRLKDRLDEAFLALDRAAQTAEEAVALREQARIHWLRGNLNFPLGRTEACLAEHQSALAIAQRAGEPELIAQALGGLGDAEYARGRFVSSYRYFQECCIVAREHGLMRIDVANRNMAAITRVITSDDPLSEVAAEADAAMAAAAAIGQQRAEIIACHAAYMSYLWMGELDQAEIRVARAQELTHRIGAVRFEPENMAFQAEILRLRGDRPAAERLCADAWRLAEKTGPSYFGGGVLGAWAAAERDAQRRRWCLETGRDLLAKGGLRHNHFFFYAGAIEAALEDAEWQEVDRYADALEAAFAAEPPPSVRFLTRRARALARIGAEKSGPALAKELGELAEEAGRLGRLVWLGPIDIALALAQDG